jgi:membrane-associated protease RseP (regulator of RpoE activity)
LTSFFYNEAGLMAIVGLMAVALFNDLSRLFGG